MAGYIAWYGKKRDLLTGHEETLVALLQRGADTPRVAEAAEERAAQVRALKAKRAELKPSEKNAVAVANLDHEIEFWLALPIPGDQRRLSDRKLRGHRSSAVRRAAR
jgi:hypothetical protein